MLGFLFAALAAAPSQGDGRSLAQDSMRNGEACAVAEAPASYLGKSMTFRAEFKSDYRHRSIVRPIGCERPMAVGALSPEAESVIAPRGLFFGWPRSQRLVVTVHGIVVQRSPNSFQFQDDDGVRFDIAEAKDPQIIGARRNEP